MESIGKVILVLFVLMILFTGCNNTNYNYNYAMVNINGNFHTIEIKYWKDMGYNQIQITDTENRIYLFSINNCTLLYQEPDAYAINQIEARKKAVEKIEQQGNL